MKAKTKTILKGIIVDTIRFFLWYVILTFIVFEISDHLPRSVDATGIGMLAVIVMGVGFILGSFRIGASYSDKLETQDTGPIFNIFKRPIRSIGYGVMSLLLSFLLLYILLWLSDFLLN